MKTSKIFLIAILLLFSTSGSIAFEKIVSIGPNITEVLFEFGLSDKIVATDNDSNYPEEASSIPKIGYFKSINAKKVLEESPDLVIALENAGTFISLAQIRAEAKDFISIPEADDFDDIKGMIRLISAKLSIQDRGESLIDKMEEKIIELEKQVAALKIIPKAVYLEIDNKGELRAFGSESPANDLITVAGGHNEMIYTPNAINVDIEFFANTELDVIFIADDNLAKVGGNEKFEKKYGLKTTKAGRNNLIVYVNSRDFTFFGTNYIESFSKVINAFTKVPIK